MPSFDIVSEVDIAEARNVVENASRELSTRYDFKGTDSSIELSQENVKISTESDFQLEQLLDIFRNACVKRQVDIRSLDIGKMEHSGKQYYKIVQFKQGIDKTTAKSIIKSIKDSKLKVQTSIQGEQVRVTGKKRDDLQSVMQLIRESDFGQPFQFENFRD